MGQFVNPQNTTSELAGLITAATEKVDDKFALALEYADASLRETSQFFQGMRSAVEGYDFTVGSLGMFFPEPLTYDFDPGDAPTAPTVALTLPNIPDIPTLETVQIPDISVPEFYGVAPEVTIPTAPSADLPGPPTAVPEMGAVDLPDKPVITMPTVPTFLGVTIPEVPTVSFPEFDASPPSESLVVPANFIEISETTYSSTLLDALKAKLLDGLVNGTTGLNADVEDSIWRREEERALAAHEEALERIADEWSKRGFSLPDGVLAANLTQAEIDYRNKRLDRARDIAIKQAELAFQNWQLVVQQSGALENVLINFGNAVAQRRFEQIKAYQDASIAIYAAAVQRLTAQIEIYKTRAAVYEARIRAELGKAEYYRIQMQAAQIAVEVNRTFAEIYRLQLAAVESMVNLYRVELEAAKLTVAIDQSRIEAFKAQVEAFVAVVNAKTSEFNMFNARIEGEKAKVQIYGAQVDAYGKLVDATRADASIKIEKAKVTAEYNRDLIDRYKAEIERYRAEVQGLVEVLTAEIKVYDTQANIYRSKSDSQAAIANVDVKGKEAAIQASISQMSLFLKQAELNMENAKNAAALSLEASKGGAQVAAQLAAGMFAGVSVQAHISASGSAGKTYSGSEGVSETYPHKEL